MTAFQLDQCVDSKRFASACAAEGLCETLRLPSALRNTEDPELLSVLMDGSNPLITFDRALPQQHASSIPDRHPGIIVISNFPAPQTMTISIAQRILKRYKTAFSDWHQVIWMNSVVEITTIELWHVVHGQLVHDGFLDFELADWPGRLHHCLQQNSQRIEIGRR